jgi:CheY-like chemotaxis protein
MNQLYEMLSSFQPSGSSNEILKVLPKKENGRFESFACKVLLADDNELNRFLIRKIVSDVLPLAEIIEVENGRSALETYQSFLPDIIFMDVQMPEMNGNEATAAIRKLEKEKHIPIIALTAGTQTEERESSMNAGMDDFITKPFVSAVIVDVIQKWLNVNK